MKIRSQDPYIFFGLNSSYYAGKVRSYLRKKRIPFEEHFVNHPHFKDVVGPKAGNSKLPIIEAADGAVVQDTTQIIDFLEARHPEPSVYPDGPKQRLVALIFEPHRLLGGAQPSQVVRTMVRTATAEPDWLLLCALKGARPQANFVISSRASWRISSI